MKPLSLRVGAEPLEQAIGAVLARNVVRPEGKGILFRKGYRLEAEDLEQLEQVTGTVLHIIQMEAGDIHEEAAGLRLAQAIAGAGIRNRGFNGSQFDLVAAHRGIFTVDAAQLARVNSLEGVTIFTLYDSVPLDEGEMVAGVKITPYVIAERTIEEAEALCAGRPILQVRAFQSLAVGVVIPASLDPSTRRRFETAMEQKLGWFGVGLDHLIAVENDVASYEAAFRQLRELQVDVIMTAGASSIDPLEPLFLSLDRVGATIEKHGVPVDPGSLFWLAYLTAGERRVPLFGLSSCEMFSHKTILDLVLPRVFAGLPMGRPFLVELGHGGLLTREMVWRFPTYGERKEKRAAAEP